MSGTETRKFIFFTVQEWALIGITIIWGSTFLIIHLGMREAGPLAFVTVRFMVGGSILALVFFKLLKGLTLREFWTGSLIGLFLCLAFSLQSFGLKTITSSHSAFITALYVPMVPILQWALLRKRPRLMSWVGALSAFIGLILLSGPDAMHFSFSQGEISTVLAAVSVAVFIILISLFANGTDSRRITVVQLFMGGVFSLLFMPITGEEIPAFSWGWILAAVTLGVMSAVIQLAMNWAQKSVSPTRATIIYACEPVWGGIFGRIAGDRLAPMAFVGAAFIWAGILLAELRLKKTVKADRIP